MKPIYQTIQANGVQQGDCFRCCIASLLELRAHNVPHFYEDASEGLLDYGTVQKMQDWFRSQANPLYYFEIGFPVSLHQVLHGMADVNTNLSYVVTGRNRNKQTHSMLARNARFIHDPASETITDPLPFPCADGAYRVGIIAKYL